MVGYYMAFGDFNVDIRDLDLEFAGGYAIVVGSEAGICVGIVPVSFQFACYLQAAAARDFQIFIAAIEDMEWSCYGVFDLDCDVGGGEAEYEFGMGVRGIGVIGDVVNECDKDI